MLNSQILTTLIALGAATRSGAPVAPDLVQPWLDKHLPGC